MSTPENGDVKTNGGDAAHAADSASVVSGGGLSTGGMSSGGIRLHQRRSSHSSHNSSVPVMPTTETFEDLDQRFGTSILNPAVRKIVQLCFASLATVFITSGSDDERERGARRGGGANGSRESKSSTNRMACIPMEAAFMLWEELLSLNRTNGVHNVLNDKVRTQHRYPGVGGFMKGGGKSNGSGGSGSRKGSLSRPGFVPGTDPDNFGSFAEGSSDEEMDLFGINSDEESTLVDAPIDGASQGGGDEDSVAAHSTTGASAPPHTRYVTKTDVAELVEEVSIIKGSKLWRRGSSRGSSSAISDNRSETDASVSIRDDTSSQYSRATGSSRSTTNSRGSTRKLGRRRRSAASKGRGRTPAPSLVFLSRRISETAAAALMEAPRLGQGASSGGSKGDDRPSNDDVLRFIRDFLVDLGLLSKVPGSVETFSVVDNPGADSNANRGGFRMMERFTKKKGPQPMLGGASNGTDGSNSSSMVMLVERKKDKEYGLRINQEFHFQYGLRLARILIESPEDKSGGEGGEGDNPQGDGQQQQQQQQPPPSSRIPSKTANDLYEISVQMNSAMAEACLEKSKQNKEKLQESIKEQFVQDIPPHQQQQARNDHLEKYGERFYFACALGSDSRTVLVDDPTIHALRMLPTYLMRSHRVVEAATLLSCTGFARGRVMILGVEEGAKWHRLDCAELQRRVLESPDRKEVDEKGATIAAYNTMVTSLLEKESSYGVNSRQHISGTNSKNMSDAQRNISTEVGKAFHAMGLSASKQGFLKLSLECYKEALSSKRAVFGHDDVSVAATLHNMGNVYLSKGWYQQATECYEEVLRVQKLKLGDKHKKVCATLHSLGTVYGMTGTYDEAIKNYQEALVLEKIRYGEDQLPVAKTLNSIGIIHGMNGSYADAVACYREALRIKRLKLGFSDEEVASTLYNLGIVQSKNGQYKDAMLSYKEALRIRRMIVGDDHEDVARILHYIGTVHADLAEYDEAIVCYQEALEIRRNKLGPDHEDVARTLHNMGLAYDQNNNDEKALEYFEQSLKIARKNFGTEHEKVADTLHRMGVVCNKTAKYEQGLQYYDEALRIRRMKLGDDHLDVASTFHNLGDVYYVTNSYDQAMECYEKALQVRRAKLGDEHVDVAATLNNMGVVFLRRGQNSYAIDCYKEALKVRKLKLGDTHEKVADTLHNIGLVYKNMVEHDLAMEHYREALRVRRITLGDSHAKVADTLYNMGIVYSNSGQYEEALECYEGALTTYEAAEVSTDHPSVVNTIDWITWIKRQLEAPLV